jgi:hypothetical protein
LARRKRLRRRRRLRRPKSPSLLRPPLKLLLKLLPPLRLLRVSNSFA